MDLSEQITQIQQKSKEINEKKIRLQERLRAEKKKLSTLLKQIKEAGYDPKNLQQIKEQKEKELNETLEIVQQKISKSEEILNEIESNDEISN